MRTYKESSSKFFHLALITSFSLIIFMGSNFRKVYGADCSVTISGNDQMQFDKKEIKVPKDCKKFEVALKHSGKMPLKTMGHNWVLTKESDWRDVAIKEASRFPKSPDDVAKDKRIIAQTTFVGGAADDPKQTKVTVDVASLSKSTNYQFFCSFPGHFAVMNGKFILEK